MKAAASMPTPIWSRNRWAAVVSGLALAQAALILGLTRWPVLPVPPVPPTAHVRWVSVPVSGLAEAALLLPEPLLFVREDGRGFSGAAARSLPRNDYEVAEFKATPRWLEAGQTARPAGETLVRVLPELKPPVPPEPVLLAGGVASPLLDPASQVTLRGPLARRPLVEPLLPPVWKSTEVLPASVVEVGVTGAGDVLMARLVSTSGLPAADEAALALARQARFLPVAADRRDPGLSAGEMMWGEIAFAWRTEP